MQVAKSTLVYAAFLVVVVFAASFYVLNPTAQQTGEVVQNRALTQQAADDAETTADSAAAAAQSARRAADSTRKTAESAAKSLDAAAQSAHDSAQSSFDQNKRNENTPK